MNVKLVKTGGITGGFEALRSRAQAGLKTMMGCMIETSILINAAAHLAELTDYLDLDGNLLYHERSLRRRHREKRNAFLRRHRGKIRASCKPSERAAARVMRPE